MVDVSNTQVKNELCRVTSFAVSFPEGKMAFVKEFLFSTIRLSCSW